MFAVTMDGTIICPEYMIFLNSGIVTLLISIENSSASRAGGFFMDLNPVARYGRNRLLHHLPSTNPGWFSSIASSMSITFPSSIASSASSAIALSAKLLCFFGLKPPVGREYPISLLAWQYSRITVTCACLLVFSSAGWKGNITANLKFALGWPTTSYFTVSAVSLTGTPCVPPLKLTVRSNTVRYRSYATVSEITVPIWPPGRSEIDGLGKGSVSDEGSVDEGCLFLNA
mmetsp:Transcript_14942/g.49242  ORF Transcript_14942/g.49242 Transcript_14942/m.49242 type:complete len:230 (-) Transcript_14942:118-807(-)